MGKIKGWKKVRITHQPTVKNVSWFIGIWENRNTDTRIIIKKEGKYTYTRIFDGVTQSYLTFDTKKKVLNYATNYMKAHPNG